MIVHSWKLRGGSNLNLISQIVAALRNHSSLEEVICLQNVGLEVRQFTSLLRRVAPDRMWTVAVGVDNRVGCVIILGCHQRFGAYGSGGNGAFAWISIFCEVVGSNWGVLTLPRT